MSKRKIQIVDSLGAIHFFDGDTDLNFFVQASEVRVYNAQQGTLASFHNYTSATFIKKENKR